MLGVNEIRSNEDLSTASILALCESMLTTLEEPDMRRMLRTDQDRYYRSLKTQFKQLDDRYPGIFNVLVQYGRKGPDGMETMDQIENMLKKRDAIFAKMEETGLTREEAGAEEDKAVDYEYAKRFVRGKVISEEKFDNIVKNPKEK